MKNVCIVGYGAIAPVHAKVLQQLPNANFYAVCDCDPTAIARCAEQYAVKIYLDFEDALRDPDIDVVHICTPHYLHLPMIRSALQNGKAVVVEKPVTRTAQEFSELLALDDSDRVCVIIQNRYNHCIQELKQMLDNGELGELLDIKGHMAWHKDPQYYLKTNWKGKWATEGGSCLINQALHTLDLMVYLGGKVDCVQGSMHNYSLQGIIETEDTVKASLQFANGAHGRFYATNAHHTNSPVEIEVTGTKATARYNSRHLTVNEQIVADDQAVSLGQNYWGGGHYFQLKDYYECNHFFTPKDMANTMNTLFGIYQSAANDSIAIKL